MNRGSYSTEQMIALHAFFAEGAAAGEAVLADQSGCTTEVEVVEVRCGVLDEFGERGLRVGDDLVAAVVGRLEGGLAGSLVLALEPEEALAWARMADPADPLEAFQSLGRGLLEGVASALSEALHGSVALTSAGLIEGSEPCLLAGTHAPADTLVVSARLRITARDETLSAAVHALLEPKSFARVLAALSAPIH
jgi:hypothetical protein